MRLHSFLSSLIIIGFLLFLCTDTILAIPKAQCQDTLFYIKSNDGREFFANSYGIGRWKEKTDRGILPYTIHAWKGKVERQTVYLTFTEIPSTSGPNWGSEKNLNADECGIKWQTNSEFKMPDIFRVYSGPLAGEWERIPFDKLNEKLSETKN